MQTRAYALSTIALGIVGVIFILLFVTLASGRIDRALETGLIEEGRALSLRFSRQIDQLLSQKDSALDARLETTWRRVQSDLDAWFDRDPSFSFASFSFKDWAASIDVGTKPPSTLAPPSVSEVAGPDEQGNLLIRLAVPSWSSPEEQIQCQLMLRPVSLRKERDHLARFVTFSAFALGVGLYLVAALMILTSRAQIRLANKEHEKATRLRAMGEVAGGIAHEVRNPLNGISLSVQYLEKLSQRPDRPPSTSDFARIHIEVGKIRKIVDNFVKFARQRDLVVGPMDLGEIVEEVLARRSKTFDELKISRELSKEGELSGVGDREKISEVLDTVVENAIDAMRAKGSGELRIRIVGTRKSIRITVRDTGEVLDESVIRNIFVPYFTTRDNALGLGMTIARTLVEAHGGQIEASAAQNGGCIVSITLPRRFLT